MKKNLLNLAALVLFVIALLFSFSSTSSSKNWSFFDRANALTGGGLQQVVILPCSDGSAICTCGLGTSNCTPFGTCPGN